MSCSKETMSEQLSAPALTSEEMLHVVQMEYNRHNEYWLNHVDGINDQSGSGTHPQDDLYSNGDSTANPPAVDAISANSAAVDDISANSAAVDDISANSAAVDDISVNSAAMYVTTSLPTTEDGFVQRTAAEYAISCNDEAIGEDTGLTGYDSFPHYDQLDESVVDCFIHDGHVITIEIDQTCAEENSEVSGLCDENVPELVPTRKRGRGRPRKHKGHGGRPRKSQIILDADGTEGTFEALKEMDSGSVFETKGMLLPFINQNGCMVKTEFACQSLGMPPDDHHFLPDAMTALVVTKRKRGRPRKPTQLPNNCGFDDAASLMKTKEGCLRTSEEKSDTPNGDLADSNGCMMKTEFACQSLRMPPDDHHVLPDAMTPLVVTKRKRGRPRKPKQLPNNCGFDDDDASLMKRKEGCLQTSEEKSNTPNGDLADSNELTHCGLQTKSCLRKYLELSMKERSTVGGVGCEPLPIRKYRSSCLTNRDSSSCTSRKLKNQSVSLLSGEYVDTENFSSCTGQTGVNESNFLVIKTELGLPWKTEKSDCSFSGEQGDTENSSSCPRESNLLATKNKCGEPLKSEQIAILKRNASTLGEDKLVPTPKRICSSLQEDASNLPTTKKKVGRPRKLKQLDIQKNSSSCSRVVKSNLLATKKKLGRQRKCKQLVVVQKPRSCRSKNKFNFPKTKKEIGKPQKCKQLVVILKLSSCRGKNKFNCPKTKKEIGKPQKCKQLVVIQKPSCTGKNKFNFPITKRKIGKPRKSETILGEDKLDPSSCTKVSKSSFLMTKKKVCRPWKTENKSGRTSNYSSSCTDDKKSLPVTKKKCGRPRKSLNKLPSTFSGNHGDTENSRSNLTMTKTKLGRPRKSLNKLPSTFSGNHGDTENSRSNLTMTKTKLGRPRKSLNKLPSTFSGNHGDTENSRSNLTMTKTKLGRPRKSLNKLPSTFSGNHGDTENSRSNLTMTKKKLGRPRKSGTKSNFKTNTRILGEDNLVHRPKRICVGPQKLKIKLDSPFCGDHVNESKLLVTKKKVGRPRKWKKLEIKKNSSSCSGENKFTSLMTKKKLSRPWKLKKLVIIEKKSSSCIGEKKSNFPITKKKLGRPRKSEKIASCKRNASMLGEDKLVLNLKKISVGPQELKNYPDSSFSDPDHSSSRLHVNESNLLVTKKKVGRPRKLNKLDIQKNSISCTGELNVPMTENKCGEQCQSGTNQNCKQNTSTLEDKLPVTPKPQGICSSHQELKTDPDSFYCSDHGDTVNSSSCTGVNEPNLLVTKKKVGRPRKLNKLDIQKNSISCTGELNVPMTENKCGEQCQSGTNPNCKRNTSTLEDRLPVAPKPKPKPKRIRSRHQVLKTDPACCYGSDHGYAVHSTGVKKSNLLVTKKKLGRPLIWKELDNQNPEKSETNLLPVTKKKPGRRQKLKSNMDSRDDTVSTSCTGDYSPQNEQSDEMDGVEEENYGQLWKRDADGGHKLEDGNNICLDIEQDEIYYSVKHDHGYATQYGCRYK